MQMTCEIGYRTTVLYECLCKMAKREEKLRHVAMVAKFLDDNKLIDLIQLHLICRKLVKFLGLNPRGPYLS